MAAPSAINATSGSPSWRAIDECGHHQRLPFHPWVAKQWQGRGFRKRSLKVVIWGITCVMQKLTRYLCEDCTSLCCMSFLLDCAFNNLVQIFFVVLHICQVKNSTKNMTSMCRRIAWREQYSQKWDRDFAMHPPISQREFFNQVLDVFQYVLYRTEIHTVGDEYTGQEILL